MTTAQLNITRESIFAENKGRVNWNKKYMHENAFDFEPESLPLGLHSEAVDLRPSCHHLPGYSGYVAQEKFTFGTTYGNVTDGVFQQPQDYNQTWQEQYPEEVQQPRLPQISRQSGQMRHSAFHCPGYSGHVPGKNAMIARTYPSITRECIQERQILAQERTRQVAELSGSRRTGQRRVIRRR